MSTFNYYDEQFPFPAGKWKGRTANEVYDELQQLSTDSWVDIQEAERLWQLKNDSDESDFTITKDLQHKWRVRRSVP